MYNFCIDQSTSLYPIFMNMNTDILDPGFTRRGPTGYKSDRTRFLKKNLWGSQMGENPHFGGIFDVFCPYLKNGSKDFNEIFRLNSPR